MQDQNNSPFNSRFIVAMLVFGGFYLGWNFYLQKKYPGYGKKAEVSAAAPISANDGAVSLGDKPAQKDPSGSSSGSSIDSKSVSKQEEKVIPYSNENFSFNVSSRGLGIKNVEIKNYKDENHESIKVGASDTINLFEIKMADGSDVYFDMQEVEKGKFRGVYSSEIGRAHV